QLLQQGCIGMKADAAAGGAGGTALPQRTARTHSGWKLAHLPGCKGHDLATWTPPFRVLPIQLERAFGQIRPPTHRPRLAEKGQRLRALLYKLTSPMGPVNMHCPQGALLCRPGRLEGMGDTGLRGMSRGDPHRNDPACVQSAQPMAFVAIHEQTPP